MNIREFRQKYPQYDDVDDQTLSDSLYKKHYSDMARAEFDQSFIGQQPERQTFMDAPLGVQPTNARTIEEPLPEARALAADVGPIQAGAIATGRGLYNIGRGLGIADPADPAEEQAMQALQSRHPTAYGAGEIVGESLPFLPAAVATGGIASTPLRVAANVALGATEGGTVAKGQGADPLFGAILGGSLGGLGEVVLPAVINRGGALFRKVTGKAPQGALVDSAGRATPEFQSVLDQEGLTLDDLAGGEIKRLQESGSLTTEQAERVARFRSEGVEPTLGDITQDYSQQAKEARLFESSAEPLADEFRTARLEQSDKLREGLEGIVSEAGDPNLAGEAVKESLTARQRVLKKKKNRLYKIGAERAQQEGVVPIFTEGIIDAMPDRNTLQRVSTLAKPQAKAVKDLLVEYGIDKSEGAVNRFKGDITPLNTTNFENFRAALNQIERSDTTGAISNITGPLKRTLDRELDDLAAMGADTGAPDAVLNAIKRARETVRLEKTEFSPQSIVGKLVSTKKGSAVEMIEASQVQKKLMAQGTPVESLDTTISSLRKSPNGRKAIGNMQASTVLDLMNSAFSTQTSKVGGKPLFNPNAFNKKLDSLVDSGKLDVLFKDNPAVLKRLKNIGKIAADMQPPAGAKPKGSATTIQDVLKKLNVLSIFGRIKGAGIFAEGIAQLSGKRAVRGDVKRALNPRLERTRTILEKEFPQLASAMGIPVAIDITQPQGEQ